MTRSNKTITVSRAKKAFDGWDGLIEVSVQKIGDYVIDSTSYSDIEYAVADFNEIIIQYENCKPGGHIVVLSKAWLEEPDDGYSMWKSEPVIVKIVGIGKPCVGRRAEGGE